jgi:uncharacterized protein YkwD
MRVAQVRLVAALAAGAISVAISPISLSPARAELWAVPSSPAAHSGGQDLDAFEDAVMVKINAARARAGMPKIEFYDSCIDRLSEKLSTRIVDSGTLAHRDQNQVLRRCRQSWAGEDLVRGVAMTPDSVVQAWLDSPPHREILLKRRASRAGVAVSVDAQGRYVGVLNVADPH